MFRMTRMLASLAVVVAACGDGPSAVPTRAISSGQPLTSKADEKGDDDIDAIVDALNAGWAAKNAVAYAAPFAEDAEVITPVGTILSGRAAIQARHVILFNGPLATSTQVVSIRRVQFLTGTIAIVDADAVLTGFAALPPGQPATSPGVARSLVRWVVTKQRGDWEIVAQQSTAIPPTP